MNNIILYGLGGASDNYRVLRYWRFMDDNTSIGDIKWQTRMMVDSCPSIEKVYLVNNSSELYWDYKRVRKTPSIENNVIFKHTLEYRGLVVYEQKKQNEELT